MGLVLASGGSRCLLQFHRRMLPRFSTTTRSTKFPILLKSNTTICNQQQQQLNLSVLRFTLGIPGLDESYLPRYIGVACGFLIAINHFLSSGSPTPAQLRSEALGMCLAAFSAVLPYLGKFLKVLEKSQFHFLDVWRPAQGASPVDRSSVPEGNKQIFVMSEDLSDIQKEELAWGSYALLRNTNTMSVLIKVENCLCVRGYWKMPEDYSKGQIVDWLKSQLQQAMFLDLKEAVYFPQSTDSQLQSILPNGTCSIFVQPVLRASNPINGGTAETKGLILLASSANYAYSDGDRAWIRSIASKFQGSNIDT